MHRTLFIACAALLWLAAPVHAADAPPVASFTLKNGLEVIVIENHRVPAISHTLWYRVGAADDPPGKSGLAHYHEHAMFLGTAQYKAGEFSATVAREGGEQNAFTGHDATAYYINIAKEKLPLAMQMEADRMRGLAPAKAAMEKEKQVIIEERRMRIENSPQALLSEQVAATLFRHHPYHIPVIGWMHEMEGLSESDVLAFHRAWYHPNNALLIVSGDITAGELRPLAEKYYGGLKKAELPARRWNAEPPHIAARSVTLRHVNVKEPTWERAYAASSLGYGQKADTLPLFVLAQVLGGGKGSRLYRALVTEQKIATEASVDYNGFSMGPGEFSLRLVPAQGIDPATVEKAADAELARFLQQGLTDEELSRAKTLLKAETIYAREGLSGMAMIMGWIRMIGLDKDYFTRWPSLIDAVGKADIYGAAKNTLQAKQSVTALLLPQQTTEKAP